MQVNNPSENRTTSDNNVSSFLPVLIFAVILSYFIYGITMKELPRDLSDLNGHVYVYLATFTGSDALEGWKMAPYFLWHAVVLFFNKILLMPVDVSASVTCSLFALGSYFVTAFMISRWCRHIERNITPLLLGFISFAFTVLQPVWIGFLDAGISRGLGSFSINPLFNPTHMAARPFALCCFMLVLDLFRIQSADEKKDHITIFFDGSSKRISILLAVMLFLSATAKPVFAEMFIPAVGLIMLFRQLQAALKKDGSGKKYFLGCLLPTFCAAIPCIICILVQFSAYFLLGGSYGGGGGLIITDWLLVWSHFTENIPLSILFGMSFPILIIVTDLRNFIRTHEGILGMVSFGVGFLECALLGEGGDKLYHGDFIWPMLFGMLMLWAASLLHFLRMEKRGASVPARIIVYAGWILILIHLHYGFLYICEILDWSFFIF